MVDMVKEGKSQHTERYGDHSSSENLFDSDREEKQYPLRERKPKKFLKLHHTISGIEDDPVIVEDAMSRYNRGIWKNAMKDEYNSFIGSWRTCRRTCSQSEIFDYKNIRMLFVISVECDLLDVTTAFLDSDSEEEVYMNQPDGFVLPGEENKVCLLRKAIYGLKQSSWVCNERVNGVLIDKGIPKVKLRTLRSFQIEW
ncbi:hypothetical protein JTB14_022060 [Gonioctena quinquepunctata]|nr:hypothetical protein JTB14_022060 [Gonioctena quinquepunctata]